MENETIIFAAFMLIFGLLCALSFIVPFLSFSQDMGGWYTAFAATCHQKASRSLCVFEDGKSLWIGDCTPQQGTYVDSVLDRATIRVQSNGAVGYKMPLCARDIGIYGALVIGGIVYYSMKGLKDRHVPHAAFLVLSIAPLGIDGSVQLASEIGLLPFLYESTNMIRLLTGAIAGFVSAFYALPILFNMFSPGRYSPQQHPEKGKKGDSGQ